MSEPGSALAGGPAARLGPPAATGAAIDVVAARKEFGAKVALDGVDLHVPAGSFCVLLGPSGSGKTTLLRCVAGIERLTSGRVTLGGRLVAEGAAHLPPERRDLAMVFQDYALWPHLTARRNVEFALGRRAGPRWSRRSSGVDLAGQASAMLQRVGLGHLSARYPNELSGGEQQRVALARALVAGTGVLLFDEPLSNLDADLRERMRLEIGTLARAAGATSLYITHDQSEAFALADVVGVLCDGRIVQLAAPEEVYHRPATPFVARFTGLAGELPVDAVASCAGDPAAASQEAGAAADRPALVAVRARFGAPEGAGPILATASAGGRPEGPLRILIRPAGVDLLPPGHPDRHLEGVVLDAAYRGRGYDHAVLVADGARLVGIHDERRWARGDRVAIRLAPSACMLFATEADSGGERTDVGSETPPPTGQELMPRLDLDLTVPGTSGRRA